MDVATDRQTRPTSVGFLLIDGFALMSYASAVEPLRAANLLSSRTLHAIDHFCVSGRRVVSSTGAVVPAKEIESGDRPELLLVVAGGDPSTFNDRRAFRWLGALARAGVTLGGVSGGPMVLARAGAMEKRRLTIHWEHAEALAEMVPGLVVERTLYVVDRDRMTCAGGTAPLDMMHALVARQHGESLARRVSDWFLHTEVRPSCGPQRAGIVERYGTTSRPAAFALGLMEDHLADPLSLDQLARLAGVGVRHLNRLFQEKLGRSTMEVYRDIRLDKANSLLRQSTLSATEVALATGFGSSSHFSLAFRRRFGMTPSDVRDGGAVASLSTPVENWPTWPIEN